MAAGLLALSFAVSPLPRVHAAETAPAASTSVQVLKDSYSPAAITVRAGDTVTWTNVDTTPGNGHTVTSSGRGPLKSPSFGQGGTFSYTFSTTGSYAYYCAIHPDMTGTVTVN
jgi:plastocyanin